MKQPEQLALPLDIDESTGDIVAEIVPKHPYANCSGCPLYDVGTYVPSSFPTKPCSTGNQLAFIGEAPGKNEIRQGQVFIGASGKVLNHVLKGYGIDRSELLMTNAAACHYPEDKFDKLPAAAVEHCRPRLIHELGSAKVQTAVTLGAHAVRSLLDNKEGITLARAGGPRPSDFVDGLLVVPTYHPAYAMRDHTKFRFVVSDFGKINDGIWDKWTSKPYRVIRTEIAANHEIMRLWNTHPVSSGPIVVDTESGRDKDEAYGGAIKDVLCIGIWDRMVGETLVFPNDVMNVGNRRLMGKLFAKNGLDGQNLKYDICRVLNVWLGVDGLLDLKIHGDRMLQSYALCEVSGVHSLEYMGIEHLGTPRWKHIIQDSMEEGRRKAKAEAKARGEKLGTRFNGLNYGFVDPEVLYEYNSYDVAATHALDGFFNPILDKTPGARGLYNHLLDVSNMLIHVEQRGMEVDLDYNAELEVEYRAMLDSIDFGVDMEKFNPNSPKQVLALFQTMGVKVESTDRRTLTGLIDGYQGVSGRENVIDFCKTLLEHRGASKIMGTYITGLRRVLIDGVAHPDFSVLSSTGRLKGRDPNPHNVPKADKLRRQFVARQGKVFLHADYGQAELRVMAWLARDEMLRQMFMSPGDIFRGMCQSIWPTYLDWPVERRDNGRKGIKAVAYGTAYGRKANSIAADLRISVAEAKRLQASFNAQIPQVIEYQNKIKRMALSNEPLVTVFGRQRRFDLVTQQNKVDVENEAMAHMPQSTANDICLLAAVQLDKMGIPIVNLIHDDIMTEVDTKDVDEVGRLMRKVMIDTAEEVTDGYVPFKVDYGTGKHFGDFHD